LADKTNKPQLVAEFRAMLAALDPETPMSRLEGKYFFGFRIERGKETEFSFRARGNGITFTLSAKEWKAVRELFRRATETPFNIVFEARSSLAPR
jgi:hypothetical protein